MNIISRFDVVTWIVSVLRLHSYDLLCIFFFFNDTATTEIYTLSLHDALPISISAACRRPFAWPRAMCSMARRPSRAGSIDRKSTRLNSSHLVISYAVFCLKKKKNSDNPPPEYLRCTYIHSC